MDVDKLHKILDDMQFIEVIGEVKAGGVADQLIQEFHSWLETPQGRYAEFCAKKYERG